MFPHTVSLTGNMLPHAVAAFVMVTDALDYVKFTIRDSWGKLSDSRAENWGRIVAGACKCWTTREFDGTARVPTLRILWRML